MVNPNRQGSDRIAVRTSKGHIGAIATAVALLLIAAQASAALPRLTVSDISVDEDSSGSPEAGFAVRLTKRAPGTVHVDYTTVDDTALSPYDYADKEGTLRIRKGKRKKTVNVPVVPDTADEPNETFDLTLSNPTGAKIKDGSGTATILDDDGTAAAGLLLNEVAPNITGSADLIELRAIAGGAVTGTTFVQDSVAPTTLATLPALTVANGDLIVVHLTPPAGVATETLTKTDCVDAACFPGAWDVAGGTMGVTFTDRVLAVAAPSSDLEDAVAFARPTSADRAGYPPDVQNILALGHWAGACGAPCDYASSPSVVDVSFDWSGASSSTGASTAARNGADTHQKTDWAVGPSTMGAPNN
jgi:hypothetical protein